MAAAKQVRSSSRRRASGNSPKQRPYKSPLDRAAGFELVWDQVSPIFDLGRRFGNAEYVYFVGEEGGPIKIGWAKDPIVRLRGLQTGNPRRLRIEYVLLGGIELERLMQEMWHGFAIRSKRKHPVAMNPGTEWFEAEIRQELEPILKAAAREQLRLVKAKKDETIMLDDLERVVRLAHGNHGFVAKTLAPLHYLGAAGGYVAERRSRVAPGYDNQGH